MDTREQKPLSFKHSQVTEVEVSKLDVGDYACEFNDGYRPPLVFERKSIADLYGTMTNGYVRFRKEVARAVDSNTQLIIVVEGSFSEVLKGYKYSKFKGSSMGKKLMTLAHRYNLWTQFCSDRREMSSYILYHYLSIGTAYIKGEYGT